VNCGAVPENLAESVFFGHEKGAFTGASYKSIGKFREADKGTLFLDEISDLSMGLQVKLLRALQQGEVQPVGSSSLQRTDVRVIAASNRNLEELVRNGSFREDLYYRLNVMPLRIPPLRERKGDTLKLAQYFLRRFAAMENKGQKQFSEDALRVIESYYWPGNIRQLENLVYRLVVLVDEEILEADHLQEMMPSGAMECLGGEGEKQQVMRARKVPLLNDEGELRRIRDLEEDVIYFALKFYNGRISEVARRLGIGRSTLYRKMNDFDIQIAS
jgi:DNA-binding NtrC family response regulator